MKSKLTEEQIIIIDEWCTHMEESGIKQIPDQLTCEVKGGYCCLGLVSEMAVEAGIVIKDGGTFRDKEDRGDYEHQRLTYSIMHWLGFEKRNPTIVGQPVTLAQLNDSGKTFPEIAKIVRKALLS